MFSDPAFPLILALVVAWAAALIYIFLERKRRRQRAAPPPRVTTPQPEPEQLAVDQEVKDSHVAPVGGSDPKISGWEESGQEVEVKDSHVAPVSGAGPKISGWEESGQEVMKDLEPAPSGPPSETWFHQLSDAPSFAVRVARASLVFLAVIVAAGFVLLLLPQSMMERMVQTVRATKAADVPSDKIALLYLGDEVKGDEFHIRGVVRNISNEPVQKLDAVVRLYAGDNTLLETVVVRMHLEVIPPDATSEFHLSYPKHDGQFTSYSVDFKLREGEPVSYKDRRGVRYLN